MKFDVEYSTSSWTRTFPERNTFANVKAQSGPARPSRAQLARPARPAKLGQPRRLTQVIRPNLRTKIMDFRGFDSCRILILRGGILMYIVNIPESLSQATLVRIILVGTILVGKSHPASQPSRTQPTQQASQTSQTRRDPRGGGSRGGFQGEPLV